VAEISWVLVIDFCNCSYSGGRDQEDQRKEGRKEREVRKERKKRKGKEEEKKERKKSPWLTGRDTSPEFGMDA
jgi:hypothetical protein